MGILDALFRFRKPPPMTLDPLLSMPDASVDLEQAGVVFTGKAGLCFKGPGTKDFEDMIRSIEAVLKGAGAQFGIVQDEYRYTWVVLTGDMATAVASISHVHETLKDAGYERDLLCAVFSFRQGDRRIYWIYNRQGKFYPFAPIDKERDVVMELRLKGLAPATMPLEESISQWYPLWDLPF